MEEKSIIDLEKELKEAKARELKKKWEIYLDKVKSFVDSIVGKIIVVHCANGRFVMYKVLGYVEQYYINRQGAYGQWSPERWIEITTDGFISCSVADDKGNWFNPSISNPDFSKFQFIVNKSKKLDIAKFDFNDHEVREDCLTTINNLVVVGKTEFDEYREDPNYDRAIGNMLNFSQVMDSTEVYEEAKRIHYDHVQKVKDFWINNKTNFDNLKQLYSYFPNN